MIGKSLALLIVGVGLAAGPMAAAQPGPPPTWDNLVKVPSKKLQAVYLLPGADFRPYTKVMLDPTEVSFAKNWMRDMNEDSADPLKGRVNEADAEAIANEVRKGVPEVFAKVYQDAGYQVVTTPAADVIRVRPSIANLYVDAPKSKTDDYRRVYAVDAGDAALVLEVRDSVTGAVLGRALDQREIEGVQSMPRSTITNRTDFQQQFRTWAQESVAGMNELKSLSPVNAQGVSAKR